MEEKMIYVPLESYTRMAETCGRVQALEGYMKFSPYSISKEMAAAILGLELPEEAEDEKPLSL